MLASAFRDVAPVRKDERGRRALDRDRAVDGRREHFLVRAREEMREHAIGE